MQRLAQMLAEQKATVALEETPKSAAEAKTANDPDLEYKVRELVFSSAIARGESEDEPFCDV